jgi:hypothetical protein
MARKKQESTGISLRAGTDLTYNITRGSSVISRKLRDIEYIKPEKDVYLAISLNTSVTALGETLEEAYSSLIFKLYAYLRDVISTPGVEIGEEVPKKLIKESLGASRMPQDRQKRALDKGIEAFLETNISGSKLILSKIECIPFFGITTPDLDDTIIPIDVVVSNTCVMV